MDIHMLSMNGFYLNRSGNQYLWSGDNQYHVESSDCVGSSGGFATCLPETNVLFIGATGHGKSTTANFLWKPEYVLGSADMTGTRRPDKRAAYGNAKFKIGVNSDPETQSIHVGRVADHQGIQLVDTPGFFETNEADVQHMLDVLKFLKELKEIHCVIVCHKYEHKATPGLVDPVVSPWKRLLEDELKKRVILLITGDMYDDLDEKKEGWRASLTDYYKQALSIDGDMPVFMLDALPKKTGFYRQSKKVRKEIIEKIKSFDAVSTCAIEFPKLEWMKLDHAARADEKKKQLAFVVKQMSVATGKLKEKTVILNAEEARRESWQEKKKRCESKIEERSSGDIVLNLGQLRNCQERGGRLGKIRWRYPFSASQMFHVKLEDVDKRGSLEQLRLRLADSWGTQAQIQHIDGSEVTIEVERGAFLYIPLGNLHKGTASLQAPKMNFFDKYLKKKEKEAKEAKERLEAVNDVLTRLTAEMKLLEDEMKDWLEDAKKLQMDIKMMEKGTISLVEAVEYLAKL